MNILFLTPRFPYPSQKGEQLRAYQFIKRLSQRGHRVTLISFVEKADLKNLSELEKFCQRVYTLKVPLIEKLGNFIKLVFTGIPMQSFPFFSKKMNALIDQVLQNEDFDLVQIALIRMAHFLPKFQGLPVVLDLVDNLSINMFRRFKREKLIKKLAFYLEWQRMKNYEDEILARGIRSLVVSQAEKEAFTYQDNIEVIPVGVDLEKIPQNVAKYPDRIIFTGNLAYFPNIDAAVYFADEIFPRIKAKRPEMKFYIVGANPAKKIQALQLRKDIIVAASVPNLYEYVSSAAVAVAPLRAGTGIQIKVLEAMACRTPVVATDFAIKGIECSNNKHLLVSDDPDEFANNVLALLEKEAKRNDLVRGGLELIKQKYDWERLTDQLIDVYQSAQAQND